MDMRWEKLKEVNTILPNETNAFKGILKTNQVVWIKGKDHLYLRCLSCIECSNRTSCIFHAEML